MNWQVPRLDGDEIVAPAMVCILRAPRHPEVGRAGDALPAGRCDSAEGVVAAGPDFDFHESDDPAL